MHVNYIDLHYFQNEGEYLVILLKKINIINNNLFIYLFIYL